MKARSLGWPSSARLPPCWEAHCCSGYHQRFPLHRLFESRRDSGALATTRFTQDQVTAQAISDDMLVG